MCETPCLGLSYNYLGILLDENQVYKLHLAKLVSKL